MKGEATVGSLARNGVRVGDPAAPLFLVGVPRSGTTLLYKLLCLHPDVAYISNWMRIAPGVPALALVNRLTSRFPDTPQNRLVRRRPGQRLRQRRPDAMAPAAVP